MRGSFLFQKGAWILLTFIIVLLAITALVGLDQAIKLWAIANLRNQPARPFLQVGSFDWMHLNYVENRGAAFSIMSGNRGFLIVFPLVMLAVCLYLLHRYGKKHRWLYAALPLIAAGGLGNLIDRIFRGGAVVDYLDVQLFRFAVFNFADICVTIGVAITLICILFFEKEVPDAKKAKQAGRIPFARTAGELPEAATLPEADALPEAGEREILPELTEDSEDAGA